MKIAEVFSMGLIKHSVKALYHILVCHLLGWGALSGDMLKCWQDSLAKQKGLCRNLNQYFKFLLRHLDLFFTLEFILTLLILLTPVITSLTGLFLNLGY